MRDFRGLEFSFISSAHPRRVSVSISADISRSRTAIAVRDRFTPREMKEVEEASKRHVTFSKRKLGLFNKVTELSILCEVETALIVSSQNGRLYACGYPNPDAVIQRFLSGSGSGEEASTQNHHAHANKKQIRVSAETLTVLEYEALQQKLKEEKENLNNAKTGISSPFWWNNNIEEMGLEDLEQFKSSLIGAIEAKPNRCGTSEENHQFDDTNVPVTS